MINIPKITSGVAIAILAIDLLGFLAWVLSGQVPVDGFYVGAITTNMLKMLLF